MKRLLTSGVVLALAGTALAAGAVSDFEDLALAPESYWNGSDLSGGFTSRHGYYPNNYNTTYFSWTGFAYSNRTARPTTRSATSSVGIRNGSSWSRRPA